jgi:hypothetical protein
VSIRRIVLHQQYFNRSLGHGFRHARPSHRGDTFRAESVSLQWPYTASPLLSHGLSYERFVDGKGDLGGVLRIGLAGPPRGPVFVWAGRHSPVFEQTSPNDSLGPIFFRGNALSGVERMNEVASRLESGHFDSPRVGVGGRQELPVLANSTVAAECLRGNRFLTAPDAVPDRVKGLELGADDYLVKPFAFSELLARMRTILRRGPARRVVHYCAAKGTTVTIPTGKQDFGANPAGS